MLQEVKPKFEVYKISFTMEEIRPLIIRHIDIAQDSNSYNSLWNLKDYTYYHNQLKEHYTEIEKEEKPSMADKLAYIVLLSNPKRKIRESESVEDFKLFREDREPDFKIVKVIEAENNENDEHHEDYNDCICSYKNLKTVYFVENIHTGIVLQVGSECIKKYKLVSEKEFKSENKKHKEIIAKKNERELEVKQELPLGYYENERQLKKIKIEEEKKQIKKEKNREKLETGNYRYCCLCEDSLMNIKKNKDKYICDKCVNNDKKLLINKIKNECNRYNCNNCDTEFISILSNSEYLCKKCIKNNKIIICKICQDKFLLEIGSNDIYCGDCEVRLINCIDCNNTTIKNTNDLARCKTCQILYENKKILKKCCECEEEFIINQKETWRTYCKLCYIKLPECECLKKMVQRIVKKEGVNKGKKFYACKENKCKIIWD